MIVKETFFQAGKGDRSVGAIFMRPENARQLLVFAHGAGAGMQHGFMAGMAEFLAENGVATFRYQFPYMQQGKKSPDKQTILVDTVRAAVKAAGKLADDLPLLAGGKSLGGRMTSTAASQQALPGIKGLVFFGFPLHAPGKPSSSRGDHLFAVSLPMLFLQGTRDNLADLALLQALCVRLQAQAEAALHIVEGADHSFHVPKSTGRNDSDVLAELARVAARWAQRL